MNPIKSLRNTHNRKVAWLGEFSKGFPKSSLATPVERRDADAMLSVAKGADTIVLLDKDLFYSLAPNMNKPMFVTPPQTKNVKRINNERKKLRKRKGVTIAALSTKNFSIFVSPSQVCLSPNNNLYKEEIKKRKRK